MFFTLQGWKELNLWLSPLTLVDHGKKGPRLGYFPWRTKLAASGHLQLKLLRSSSLDYYFKVCPRISALFFSRVPDGSGWLPGNATPWGHVASYPRHHEILPFLRECNKFDFSFSSCHIFFVFFFLAFLLRNVKMWAKASRLTEIPTLPIPTSYYRTFY